MEPETRYVRNGGTAIAYQVLGSGDTDLVYVPDYMSNLVFAWQYPTLAGLSTCAWRGRFG